MYYLLGAAVVIRTPNSANTYSMVLPKFAVRGMVKTFSLTGVVLDIDQVIITMLLFLWVKLTLF